jgi:hypothetical protein
MMLTGTALALHVGAVTVTKPAACTGLVRVMGVCANGGCEHTVGTDEPWCQGAHRHASALLPQPHLQTFKVSIARRQTHTVTRVA